MPISDVTNISGDDSRARRTRVLLANTPRSYRETIAHATRRLRPDVEVETTEPGDLDSSVRRFAPDMVVCSEATEAVRSSVPVWVELYPEYGSRSVASIAGELEEYADIELGELLAILDRADALPR